MTAAERKAVCFAVWLQAEGSIVLWETPGYGVPLVFCLLITF